MNKICTDIEQSNKLMEFLPLESADMTYRAITEGMREKMIIKDWELSVGLDIAIKENLFSYRNGYMIPCWSLTALYYILPNTERISTNLSRGGWKMDPIEYMPNTWWCEYEDNENPTEYFNTSADNPVDACVAMIIKLSELKML